MRCEAGEAAEAAEASTEAAGEAEAVTLFRSIVRGAGSIHCSCMRRGWILGGIAVLLGCGRIGFDPGGLGDGGNIPPDGFGSVATGCGPPVPSGPVVYVATTG